MLNKLRAITPRKVFNSRKVFSVLCLLSLGIFMGSVGAFAILLRLVLKQSSFEPVTALQLPVSASAQINGERLALEVARTPEEHATGLMFREFLADDRGMLFQMKTPQRRIIWTKDVQFPMDLIFLSEGEVQLVSLNLPPCIAEVCPTYGASVPVDQVLALRGGRAEELQIKPGQQIVIKRLNLALREAYWQGMDIADLVEN